MGASSLDKTGGVSKMPKARRGLKEKLEAVLAPSELSLVYRSYDIVGDIAVIKVPESLVEKSRLIAEAIMETHKHVSTVLRQVTPIHGDLRIRGLEWVAGERKTETVHREFGCLFKVDLKRCYFSPRLLNERMRIARLVREGETVVNMFSGVGCYSIIIARHSKARKVYSIDINPDAVRYMRENVRLNRVEGVVEPIEGDAKDVILERLRRVADRVLMPLPEKAYKYVEYALEALKERGGWIHYYDFEHASKGEDPVRKVEWKVSERLRSLKARFTVAHGKVVRTVGPRFYQIVLDILVKQP